MTTTTSAAAEAAFEAASVALRAGYGRLLRVHARSALFDLYGDHLRSRGDRAPVASLVRMLTPLGVTPPAARTAISRMVRQGWLVPERVHGGRGYALTARARARLDEAATRIYRTDSGGWRGSWDLVVLTGTPARRARERIRSALSFLGYAPLGDGTWISPARSPEVESLLAAESVEGTRFEAYDGDPVALAARVWDLDTLARAYAAWHEEAQALVAEPQRVFELDGLEEDEQAFVVRSHLVHEWRKFLFSDPGLPVELLPADWPGHAAARFFGEEAARLLPAASRFVDRCLDPDAPTGEST